MAQEEYNGDTTNEAHTRICWSNAFYYHIRIEVEPLYEFIYNIRWIAWKYIYNISYTISMGTCEYKLIDIISWLHILYI